MKINKPIVRSYLRPIQALVPQRRDLYRRNMDFFQDLEGLVREAERAFNKIQRDGAFSTIYSNLAPVKAYEMPIIVNEDNTRLLRLKFDLDGFSPENIKLSIKDHVLTIHAKQGEERLVIRR